MMNNRFTLVMPAQQCPAAGPTAPGLRQAAEFELLKNRMLLCTLDETPEMELHISIIHAAREAAGLAWQTAFPLLVYPGLFEEKARAAREQALRQAHVHRQSLELAGVRVVKRIFQPRFNSKPFQAAASFVTQL